MSRALTNLVIEWSTREVIVHDLAAGRVTTVASLRDLTALAGRSAVFAVSRRSLFVRGTRVPNTDPETIRQILRMRAAELFPIEPSEIALDYLPTKDINVEGRLALVIVMPLPDLRTLRADAKEAKIGVLRVVPAALSAARAALDAGATDCAVVSPEPGGIGIDIVANGDLRHSRSASAGSSLEAEICRTFSVAAVACTEVLSFGVDVPDSRSLGKAPVEKLGSDWSPEWGINLELPEEVTARAAKDQSRRLRFAGLLAVSALLCCALVANDYWEVGGKVANEAGQYKKAERQLDSLKRDVTTRAAASEGFQKAIERAFRPAQRLGDVTALVANVVPEGVWLTGTSVERGKPILIRGSAKSSALVTDFVTRLSKQNRLRDVALALINNGEVDGKPVVQFSITAFPVGNLPLVDPVRRGRGVRK